MQGVLTVDQQLTVLTRIWGADREGYVFLPWIPGGAADKDARRAGYHEGPAFNWPTDKPKIRKWLADHDRDDVYFTPCMFLDERRVEQEATTESTLWADMDAADPRKVDGEYRPTIAWESSPGRYQAVWVLAGKLREGTSWHGKENHRLTVYLGADPSGWDTTQLLRVPGRPNFKPEYRKDNGGAPVPGKLLWDNGPRYTIGDFDDLPTVPELEVEDTSMVDEQTVAGIDRHDVWGRVRLKVSKRIREYMAVRSIAQAEDIAKDQPDKRSGVQWQIMRELADAGCTVPEIVAVIRPSVWNSYRGRRDELQRLKVGAAKAIGEGKSKSKEDDADALEEIDGDKPELRWLSDVMLVPMPRPRWLIRNVWSKGGCGFIAGDPKSYKSWMGLDLAVSVATGTPFLGDPQFSVPDGPQPVIYLQEEDSEIVVRHRLEQVVEGKAPYRHWHGYMTREGDAWMWNPPELGIPMGFFVRVGFTASDPGWQVWLAEIVEQANAALVIVDTLGTTAGDVDTDRAAELMAKILRPLKEISGQTGAACAVVHHNRKGTQQDQRGGQRMLGSVALHAWVDDAMYVHSREQLKGGAVKVHVERESKAATESRWVVEVPRMGWRSDGGRTVWEPATAAWDRAETVTGDTDAPTPRTSNGGRPKQQAGSVILTRIKVAGGNPTRPVSLDKLVEITAQGRPAIRRQLEHAVQNGLIAGDEVTGWWPL